MVSKRADTKKKATRLEDLAKRAGVSISTASRALNDSPSVNPRTKEAIWALARELDYPFRRYMPAGPIGADATIAVVVPRPQARDPRLSDPFFLELLSGVGEAARERSCDVMLSHIAPVTYEDLSRAMGTTRAEGVIFVGQSALNAAFNTLAQAHGRFVVWGAELGDQRYCSVGSDNVLGARRATAHLLRLGRRAIVFLGDIEAPEPMQRHRGYLEAFDLAGMGRDRAVIAPAHFEVESAEAATDALIREGRRFDAIVAASDVIAMGAMRALAKHGASVPDDVAVVGYDNIPFARFSQPALTTIDQCAEKAGRLMVSKLLDARDGRVGPSERTPTELIVRDSCGA